MGSSRIRLDPSGLAAHETCGCLAPPRQETSHATVEPASTDGYANVTHRAVIGSGLLLFAERLDRLTPECPAGVEGGDCIIHISRPERVDFRSQGAGARLRRGELPGGLTASMAGMRRRDTGPRNQ